MAKKNKFQLSYWLLFGIGLLIILGALLAGPFFPVPVAIVIAIALFPIFKVMGRLKEFKFLKDGGLIFLELMVFFLVLILMGLVAFSAVPWWKLIVAALVAEAVAWVSGKIPVAGDIAGGILIWFAVFFIIGGLPGIMLASTAAFIAFIPFVQEIPIFIFISFVVIKILAEVLVPF